MGGYVDIWVDDGWDVWVEDTVRKTVGRTVGETVEGWCLTRSHCS